MPVAMKEVIVPLDMCRIVDGTDGPAMALAGITVCAVNRQAVMQQDISRCSADGHLPGAVLDPPLVLYNRCLSIHLDPNLVWPPSLPATFYLYSFCPRYV